MPGKGKASTPCSFVELVAAVTIATLSLLSRVVAAAVVPGGTSNGSSLFLYGSNKWNQRLPGFNKNYRKYLFWGLVPYHSPTPRDDSPVFQQLEVGMVLGKYLRVGPGQALEGVFSHGRVHEIVRPPPLLLLLVFLGAFPTDVLEDFFVEGSHGSRQDGVVKERYRRSWLLFLLLL